MNKSDARAVESPRTPATIEPAFLLLIASLAAMGPFSIDLYLPAFSAIGTDLGARPDQVQTTLSAYFVGLASGQLLVGPLSDRLGRRAPLLAGLALYAVASLGCAFASSVEALTVWRFVQAAGACAGLVGSRAVLRDRFGPQDMARALSLVMLVMGLAPIVAPVVGATIASAFGWRTLFLGLTGYGIVVWLAVYFGLRETLLQRTARSPRQVLAGYRDLFRLPTFLGYAVAGSLAQAALYVYIACSSFVFTQVYGLSATAFSGLFALNAMGLIGASQLNERWLRRTSLERIIPIVIGVQTVATLVLLAAVTTGFGGLVGVLLPLFACIASVGFCFPNTTAAAMGPVGDRAGLAAALLGTLQYGTAGLATFLAGQLYDGTAIPMAAGMTLATLAGGTALVLLVPAAPGGHRWRA